MIARSNSHAHRRYALQADEVLALVRDSLLRVGMADFAERPSHTLSGGQKQRREHARVTLSLGRNYLGDPIQHPCATPPTNLHARWRVLQWCRRSRSCPLRGP